MVKNYSLKHIELSPAFNSFTAEIKYIPANIFDLNAKSPHTFTVKNKLHMPKIVKSTSNIKTQKLSKNSKPADCFK